MEYSEYIALGFLREDYQDTVVFRETGYHPFYLKKEINDRMVVYAESQELDKPVLMIYTDKENERVERIPLTKKQVLGIFGVELKSESVLIC